jgi:hypothetical protein
MWHKVLERNQFISSLYQEVPKLINVRIVAIKITDEGRRVSINFNMPMFADNAPSKWHNSGYNTVFVELDFFDVQEFNVSYCKENLRGTINIEKNEEDKFKVDISGSVNMNLVADIGIIQSVSGYIDNLHE